MIPVDQNSEQNEATDDDIDIDNLHEYFFGKKSNEAIEDGVEENDDDEQESNEFWMDWLDQYYQGRKQGHHYDHYADRDGYWGADDGYYEHEDYLRMYEKELQHEQHALRSHDYYQGYT